MHQDEVINELKKSIPEKYWNQFVTPMKGNLKKVKEFSEKILPYLEQNPMFKESPFFIHLGPGYNGNGSFPTTYDNFLEMDYSALAHEMAHGLDFFSRLSKEKSQERFSSHSWALSFTSFIDIGPERYYEPQTFNASLLETRVVGIEMRILEMSGYSPEEVKECMRSQSKALYNFMSDYCLSPKKGEEDRVAFLQEKIMESYAQWSHEKVLNLWKEAAPMFNQLAVNYKKEVNYVPIETIPVSPKSSPKIKMNKM